VKAADWPPSVCAKSICSYKSSGNDKKSLNQKKIDSFKADLKSQDTTTIVNRHTLHGTSIILGDDKDFALKQSVSKEFNVHSTSVFIVGSAKLGFSIKESRRYSSFCDTSDIDVAIVDTTLFEQIWREVYVYRKQLGWWPEFSSFRKYLFKGWIRPDFLPHGRSFQIAKKISDFFQSITTSGEFGPYKISAGIYHSHFFLENYQGICVEECKTLEVTK